MFEPKPLASLTSGLLARKGGARPAMRRQMALDHTHVGNDDLGWNDMGYDVDPAQSGAEYHDTGLSPMPAPAPSPAEVHSLPGVDVDHAADAAVEPVVVEQRRRVEALAARPAVARAPAPRAEAGAKGRFAFTLRLDAQRHLLLRLASAATNRSAQQILTKLVDDYIADQPAVAAMAAQIGTSPAKGDHA